jgi:hypothetical protein
MVRVLAARFEDRSAATGVLERLRSQYELGPADVAVAPLSDAEQDGTVLAGRFLEHRLRDVVDLIQRAGGHVVADVDEEWTRTPRPPRRGNERGRPDRSTLGIA